jgi:GNAT superfamily N-acetyltransferase
MPLPSDFGPLRLVRVKSGSDFFSFIAELENGKSGFLHNKAIIADALANGTLYGLAVTESESMFADRQLRKRQNAPYRRYFCARTATSYLLPCFCVRKKATAIILWVHPRVRRMGLGRALVEKLRLRKADAPLSLSVPFWKACGIPVDEGSVCHHDVEGDCGEGWEDDA